jgi:hypothetical protein
MQLDGHAYLLCPLIWSLVSGLVQFHNETCNECASKSMQVLEKSTRDAEMLRRMFAEESMTCTWVFEWKSPNSWWSRKERQVNSEVESMLIILFDIKVMIIHREFVMAGQKVNSTYYCDFCSDYLIMYEDFTLNFGDKRTGCCIMTTHCLSLPFSQGNFLPKTWLLPPTNPTHLIWRIVNFDCFPNWRYHHFDTIEVIKVPNILTEHNFQDAFKNGRSTGNSAYAWKGTTLRVIVASTSNVSFWPYVSTSPGNYGYELCMFKFIVRSRRRGRGGKSFT